MAEDFGALLPGEQVVVKQHPHWWYFATEIISGLLGLLVIIVLAALLGLGTILSTIAVIAILVWLVIAAFKYLSWRRTEFLVTDRRVAYHTGMLHRTGVAIPLDRISNVNYSQTFIERMFSSGDLLIESAGESGSTTFHNIPHPQQTQRVVYEQIERDQSRDSRRDADAISEALKTARLESGGSGGGGSVTQQIEELGRLRDQGLISPEEFEAKKQELLGRM